MDGASTSSEDPGDPFADGSLEPLPEEEPPEAPHESLPMPILGLPPRSGPLPPRPANIQRVKKSPRIPPPEGFDMLPATAKAPPLSGAPHPASRKFHDTAEMQEGAKAPPRHEPVSPNDRTTEMPARGHLAVTDTHAEIATPVPAAHAPATSAMPGAPDEQRFGRFLLHGRLGQGGMGEVWLATDERDGKQVALKRVRADLSEESRRRLRLEVEALARLSHRHICAVRDWGNEQGVPWFSMEALEGRSLAERLNDAGGRALPLDLVRRIALGVTEALAAAHRAQIIHRDLKPENVFLCADGGVKLLDFGIAKVRDEDSGVSLYGTQGGRGRFTPQYMAPEQATKKDPTGPGTDLYALGVMLFELLAGRLPFESATQMGFVTQHLGEAPPPLSRFRPGTPPQLDALIARLLEKRPHDRYPSAEALMHPLEHALALAAATQEDLRARLRGARSPDAAPPLPAASIASSLKSALAASGAIHAAPSTSAPPPPPPAPPPPAARHADDVSAKSSYQVGPFVLSETTGEAALGGPVAARRDWEASDERKEEYAKAAASLGQDPTELQKLMEVHRDLERPLRAADETPFSFARTCGLSAALLERLEGRSLGDAVAEMALSDPEIDELRELGRVLVSPRLSEATRRSGKIVFALASARGLLQSGVPGDPSKSRALRDLIAGVRDKAYVVERYRRVLDRAFAKLSPVVGRG